MPLSKQLSKADNRAEGATKKGRRNSVYLPNPKSKPNEVGSIWKGKTTPSVNLTPPAAADDLMVLF